MLLAANVRNAICGAAHVVNQTVVDNIDARTKKRNSVITIIVGRALGGGRTVQHALYGNQNICLQSKTELEFELNGRLSTSACMVSIN